MPLIVLLWAVLLPLFTPFLPSAAEAAVTSRKIALPDQEVRDHLKDYLNRLVRKDQSASSQRIIIDAQLLRFYKSQGYRAVWNNPQSVDRLLKVIEDSADDGLLPSDYHFDEISKFREEPPTLPALKARADLLMTDALFTLISHMRSGKVSPRSLDANWNVPTILPPANNDSVLMSAVTENRFPEMIASLRPQGSGYGQLRKGLARYLKLHAEGGWGKVPSGPMIVNPGDVDARMPLIRQRLITSGDLSADSPIGLKITSFADSAAADSTMQAARLRAPLEYTPEMAEAVKTFQKRHGLTIDGAIGNETIAAMNVPLETRIEQIRINLERLRWYPRNPGSSYVMVNIPGYTVDFFRNNTLLWHSRVIVGKPDTQTPVFRAEMISVILNPRWVIPSGILIKEAIPAIRKDIRYLTKNDLTVVGADGKPVDPLQINWAQYKEGGFPYRLVQDSGEDGSLGLLKFNMPNRFAVYMHDTPTKPLFERSRRAYSHGCVRVEKPFELAEIVLQDPIRWNQGKLWEAVDTGRTRAVLLPAKVPVYFTYQTAFAEANHLNFRADIYDRDRSLQEALNAVKESRNVEEATR